MKKLLLLSVLLITGCASAPKNQMTQVSTIDALLAGAYDGQVTIGELKKQGDFGIGTFDALEGEMIVLDGTVYQARVDGTIVEMPDSTTTPFAAVVPFEPQKAVLLREPLSDTALKIRIDQLAPNKNLFLAVRVDGTFPAMKVRSVPKQTKPYPPLADAVEHQAVFEYVNATGTVIGFRSPAFVKGIGVPDYHLHFISKDRKTGGHILDFAVASSTLQIGTCNRFMLLLPDQESFGTLDLSQDRSHELEKVEQ